MSQAGSIATGGGGGGGITQIDGDTGSATGDPITITGIDSTADFENGITTNASGSTVQIILTNRLQGADSAAGATTVDLVTFAAGATPGTYTIDLHCSLFESTTPAGAGYHIRGAVRTTGAAASLIGIPDEIVNEEAALAACDVDIVVSGNNIIIRGTGTAGLTTEFSCVGYYVFAS